MLTEKQEAKANGRCNKYLNCTGNEMKIETLDGTRDDNKLLNIKPSESLWSLVGNMNR